MRARGCSTSLLLRAASTLPAASDALLLLPCSLSSPPTHFVLTSQLGATHLTHPPAPPPAPCAGEQSRDFCVVLATNRPSDLDPAVIDRTDEAIEFALPGDAERWVQDAEGCLPACLPACCLEEVGCRYCVAILRHLTLQACTSLPPLTAHGCLFVSPCSAGTAPCARCDCSPHLTSHDCFCRPPLQAPHPAGLL